jgi:hypothetical protein
MPSAIPELPRISANWIPKCLVFLYIKECLVFETLTWDAFGEIIVSVAGVYRFAALR